MTATVAFAFALTGAGAVHAAPTDPASAASGAAVVESDAQYTVHPGQSLNDVAIALTQSHDRATLARAAKAIFDANSSAFMGHDPSRLKLGAVLNVPSLDTLGVAASGAVGAAAATGVSGTVASSVPAVASSAAVSAATSGQPASASAATANVASAPASASAPAVVAASSVAAGVASQAAESAASPAASASGAHVWAGAIQPVASAPVEGASGAGATPAVAAPQPASQVRAPVSSLQQLLALKNRVLMELQKHGIGTSKQAPQGGSVMAVQPSTEQATGVGVAPGATVASSAIVSTPQTNGGMAGLSQPVVAAVAGGVAAVIALIASLAARRRRSRTAANDEAAAAGANESEAMGDQGSVPDHGSIATPAAGSVHEDVLPSTRHAETLADATGAASLAAAAELGADALPQEQFEPSADEQDDDGVQYVGSGFHSEPVQYVEPGSSATPGIPVAPQDDPLRHGAHAEPDYPVQLETLGHHDEAFDVAQPPAPPLDLAAPSVAPTAPRTNLPHPIEFPHDAVQALGSLDMPLPPRTESPASFDGTSSPAPLTTQPVVAPEITARQAIVPPPGASHVSEEIEAGTAGSAAVAGLGAMPFGALKLDFDLELPPSPAQPLPAFTPEDIAKIARNKLELASEYIELGDLSGARALINEVIESNDAATRSEARALLSTLAPLS
ncbi:FimV/HubP family polar landmark protein [Paraburkholderia sp. BL10I2N1]|uniref:FimV/HubP family polar landmark protein n=1 Tax=Paraburkholderia sp. BL10I2N1 TaxID=1938796 RepID=UPI00106076F1|nr:FimV/HubP family polar landmark protein [Paraburkholderia sp. BL10I2N1]TDN62940.1 FimV-like protein [Paraburkholderia sp. BL10I2N1]